MYHVITAVAMIVTPDVRFRVGIIGSVYNIDEREDILVTLRERGQFEGQHKLRGKC